LSRPSRDGTVPVQLRLPIPAKYFGRYMVRAIRDGVLITLDHPKTHKSHQLGHVIAAVIAAIDPVDDI